MDWDELKVKRGEAVASMNASLEKVKASNTPYGLVVVMMVPVFIALIVGQMFSLVWSLLRVWLTLLGRIVIAPFLLLWLFADLCVMTWWFMALVCEKMGRK